jgi:hypothetical protein
LVGRFPFRVGAEVADGPCILALISGFLDCDGRMPAVDVLTNPPALEETAIWAFELALARIRLGVSCVERTPSLGRLRPRSAALNARKHRDYQGKVGATGFEPATFRPPAECAIRLQGTRLDRFSHSHAVSVGLSCP